ncbi:hypothetical protein CFN78_06775 [Amycolatopsis antarctica]|uniref:Scaffolding protein n=1 Tax=Amycolatopsis antarctica TaxID=1854586 RepID=A0A263D933_9PSEU|nr:hypothetical protein [Amycolatopsis antarctica]OZM73986.1 hypothetical protein CFN78_06775 [Amycolatopsis antarctica]
MPETTTAPATGQPADPAAPPAAPPAGQQPPATTPPAGDGSTPPAEPAKPGDDAGKRFTQADLDRIISDRLGKAEQSWQQKQTEQNKKLAALLGGEDPDQVDPAKALEDAQGTASKAVQRADRAEAKALALAAGIKPERVERFVKLCDISGALDGVDRGDDAKVQAAIQSAVDSALEDVPEFKGTNLPQSSGGDRSGGGQQTVTLEQFKAMDVDERTALYRDNKGLYKQLAEQEKK